MKATKKLLCFFLTCILTCSAGFVLNCQETEAASTVWAPNDVRCGVGLRYSGSASISLVSKSDSIKNLKVYQGKKKTKNLFVRMTYKYKSDSSPYAQLSFYAKKAGNYKIKFDVYKSAKSKRCSRTINVHAKGYGTIISTVSINGKKVTNDYSNYSSYYAGAGSAKVKFSLADGCKIKKIRVSRYDQNGQAKKVSFKNGSKVTFGKYGSSSDNDYSWQKGMWSTTTFEITYKNKYAQNVDNSESVIYYTIYTKASKWY